MILKTLLLLVLLIEVNAWKQGAVELSAWDNTLYGQPICTEIPSKMSLCNNINYKQMKVPNLLGHESVSEIVSQSAAWNPLLGISCHADTQLFLCSLFAPVCIDHAVQATIYPCRSLCEQVRDSCQAPMMAYNYPWPNMFNCSKFPEDNGFCIKPSNQMKSLTTTTIKTTTQIPSTTSFNRIKPPSNKYKHNKISPTGHNSETNQNECNACTSSPFDMIDVVKSYCNSRIVLRGRIGLYDQSSFDLNMMRRKRSDKQLSNRIVIPRRDRRFFKGARILFGTVGPFLTEKGLRNYFQHGSNEESFTPRGDLDFFLLSNDHASLLNKHRKQMRRKYRMSRSLGSAHCSCQLLEKNSSRKRYFITGNIQRVRKVFVQQKNSDTTMSSLRRDYFHRDTRSVSKQISRFLQNHFRFVQVTGIWQWSRVRPFIDYLENFRIDKTNMCNDIPSTVKAIRKADSMFF